MSGFGCREHELTFASGHKLMDHLTDEHSLSEWSDVARLPGDQEVAL